MIAAIFNPDKFTLVSRLEGEFDVAPEGYTLYTEAEYEAKISELKPAFDAAMATLTAEREAEQAKAKATARQAKIDEMVLATGMTSVACEYILKVQGVIV